MLPRRTPLAVVVFIVAVVHTAWACERASLCRAVRVRARLRLRLRLRMRMRARARSRLALDVGRGCGGVDAPWHGGMEVMRCSRVRSRFARWPSREGGKATDSRWFCPEASAPSRTDSVR